MDALKTAETYCEKLDSMVHSLNSIVQVLPSMLGTESHANDAPLEGYAFYALWLYIWATGFPKLAAIQLPKSASSAQPSKTE